jgi:hypothetical protein
MFYDPVDWYRQLLLQLMRVQGPSHRPYPPPQTRMAQSFPTPVNYSAQPAPPAKLTPRAPAKAQSKTPSSSYNQTLKGAKSTPWTSNSQWSGFRTETGTTQQRKNVSRETSKSGGSKPKMKGRRIWNLV